MSTSSEEWLTGAWDIHVHADPSLFPRRCDWLQLARVAAQHSMRGLVFKAHHGSTVESAHLVGSQVSGLSCFGGVTLNHFVGGLNTVAVEASMRLGGRVVWLPTIHAAYHEETLGPGGFSFQKTGLTSTLPGIRIVDESGRIVETVRQILALLDGSNVVLATGHISPEEIYALEQGIAADARSIRLLINHVFFTTPRLRPAQLEELVGPDVWLETCYFTISEMAGVATSSEIAAAVCALPDAQWVLASDSGQPRNPIAPDALFAACRALTAAGVKRELVSRMIRDNPGELLAG